MLRKPKINKVASVKQVIICGIEIDLVRKKIKNLNIGVYPPEGRVRVAVPFSVSEEAVRLFVAAKLSWILGHQEKIAAYKRAPAPEFITGESHFFEGISYRLNLVLHPGRPRVSLAGDTLELKVPEGADLDCRQRLLADWYRQQLRAGFRFSSKNGSLLWG